MRRFYLPQSFDAAELRLEGAEAHHLIRVLRLKAGEEITLFDGRGAEAVARIDAIAGDRARLTVLARRLADEAGAGLVTLATAVPKGERFDWLVEKATELGVARVVPLITSRSIVHPGESKLNRLRRTIIEAAKQCGRSRLMDLSDPVEWTTFVTRLDGGSEFWVGDPSGGSSLAAGGDRSQPVVAAVGPEGGFTPEELELALQHGARLVSLGPHILRIETAALAVAAHLCTARSIPV